MWPKQHRRTSSWQIRAISGAMALQRLSIPPAILKPVQMAGPLGVPDVQTDRFPLTMDNDTEDCLYPYGVRSSVVVRAWKVTC